jgi:aspartate racemase
MKRKIGIIGGAGPMASCQLYQMIIEICQKKYGCKNDFDFPEIQIISYPFADMLSNVSYRENRALLASQLQYCFDLLVAQNSELIVIACNTLHTILNEVVIPKCKFINISQVTLKESKRRGLSNVLVLATSSTIRFNLYSSIFINCIVPDKHDQKAVDNVIANILAGNVRLKDSQVLSDMILRYGAEGVILGCTELPLLYEKYSFDGVFAEILDSSRILAEKLVAEAMNFV